MPPRTRELWTIGHSTRSEQDFVETLAIADIDLVADVRSLPGSRKFPQFDKEAMPAWLGEAGVGYEHILDLGGRRNKQDVDPTLNAGWRLASFRNYADYTLTDGFQHGLKQLRELMGEHRVAIMCAEAVPWRCHRLIVSNAVTALGWTVWHLIGAGEPEQHELGQWGATPSVSDGGVVTYPGDPGLLDG